ncbi:MAG TPA: hypothetical protein VMR77_03695 [Patescibacteria group bacterium]|nr:hypothetical protein [Patescibacteria group bacterium]
MANGKKGRPLTSASKKEEMVSKIKPYLQSGLSIRKSVIEAGISRATFYRIMGADKNFRSEITHFRNYLSILVSNALVKELFAISEKQSQGQPLTKDDIRFLFRLVLKTRFGKDEWGRKRNADYDPELELHKLRQTFN